MKKADPTTLEFLDSIANSTGTAYMLDPSGRTGRIYSLDLCEKADMVLERLPTLDGLEALDVWAPNDLTVKGVTLLTEAKDLRSLSLHGCDPKQFPPNAFACLSSLPNLENLTAEYLGNGDEALQYLSGSKRIRRLCLRGNFTDEGLRHLVRLQSLTTLDLSGTHVTDAGMLYVSQLKATQNSGPHGASHQRQRDARDRRNASARIADPKRYERHGPRN